MSEIRLQEAEIGSRLVPVVLGGDTLAYSYARCFYHQYGIKTVVFSSVRVRATASSRFVDYRIEEAMSQGDEAIYEFLMDAGRTWQAQGVVPLLLGSADWQVRVICRYKTELERWFVIPYNSFSLLEEITQKGRFYEICDKLDIPYPKTWTVSAQTLDQASYLEELTYPVVAKPSNSARYDLMSFPGKEKVYTVSAHQELMEVLHRIFAAGYDRDVVVQEFIPGPDHALASLTTFSDAQGKLLAVSGGRVVLEDHAPSRVGNPMCILIERHQQLIDHARRFCEEVAYRGFANFDAKFDPRDATYKFFEVNARPGANTYYMSVGGVDFVRLLVDEFVLGRPGTYQEGYSEALYTLVPRCVIERHVADPQLRERVLALYDAQRAFSPFVCPDDTLAHRFWTWRRTQGQIENFATHMPCFTTSTPR